MGTTGTGYTAVQEKSVRSGVYIFWNSGSEVSHDKLKEGWVGEGLNPDLLPPLPEPKTALSRALDELRERRRLVRQVKTGLWSIKAEHVTEDGEDLEYATECRASLDPVGRVKVDPPDHRLAPEIRREYAHQLETLGFGRVVSPWLIHRLRAIGAVTVMADGGLYYLPEEAREAWEPVARVVGRLTGTVFEETDVVRNDQLVGTVMRAVLREAERQREQIYKEIDDDGSGERALGNRIAECEEQRSLLEQYRALLGSSLDQVLEQYDQMEAALGEAKLKAAQRRRAKGNGAPRGV